MIKKSLAILSVAAAAYLQAQDFSALKNSADVYSASVPGSAKFNAMAGATGALGGEASAINVNPAGIGVAVASDVSGTLNIQNNKNTSTLFGSSIEYKTNKADLGQVGALAVFQVNGSSPWKFVNIAANFSGKTVEDYIETSGAGSNITVDAGELAHFDRQAYNRTGYVSKMSIGVGGNYNNRFYLGAGINLHSATLDQKDTALLTYLSDNASEYFYKQYTPFHEESNGFSANVGIIGKLSNEFRLGAAIETPTWWTVERQYSYYDAQNANNDGEFSESWNIRTPLKATFSAAFVPNKNLAVNVDYAIGLTKTHYGTGDALLQKGFNDFFSDSGRSQSEVRVGAEYRISQLRLRAGYGYANSPFNNVFVSSYSSNGSQGNSAYGDMFLGSRNTFGAGIGYDFKGFYIDAAYQNISSTYSNPFLRGSADAGTQYYSGNAYFASNSALVSSVKNAKNNVSLTLGWKF